MRIAVVMFPLNDAGGIISWGDNFIAAARLLGHIVDPIHADTRVSSPVISEPVHKSRYTVLPGISLPYETDEQTSHFVSVLNGYDLVLFLHPSPHPTREVLRKRGHENWKKLYSTAAKTIVVFHDANWDRTNKWFAEVADDIDLIIAAQPYFIPSVNSFPGRSRRMWSFFPLVVPPELVPCDHRAECVILATQWVQWKKHDRFVPFLNSIRRPIRMFGAGMEYHNLKKEGKWPSSIQDQSIGEEYNRAIHRHSYRGYVSYEQLMKILGRSMFSLDLSDRGYVNMTHLEPLCRGTMSIAAAKIFAENDTKIPKELFITYPSHEDLLVMISRFRYDESKAKRAHEFAREHFDSISITRKIIEEAVK